jgi:hypothetical protein
MFELHHAWRYRIEYTGGSGGVQRYTIRCAVTKLSATSAAITSEVACTHGPEANEGLWLYGFLPDGAWVADASGLARADGGALIGAKPAHLCVPGLVGGSDEGPATQELCFGASGVPETGVATGTAPERLTFALVSRP